MPSLKSLIPRPLIIASRPIRRPLEIPAIKAHYKFLFLRRRLAGHSGTVLLEPYGVPVRMYSMALFKICAELGWSIKDGRQHKEGLRLFWPNKETPETQAYPDLINGRCVNINKSLVVKNFEVIFGYGYTVDPRNPSGPYVRKSEINGRHDGQIIEGARVPEGGFVYQRFIDIALNESMGEDIRLIYMRGLLQFCYRKSRSLETWFGQKSTTATIDRTSSLISHDEASRVCTLCDAMGLEYGELDCLRDRKDGRLYVVDVNRTPSGPPRALPGSQKRIAVREMARAFAKAFPILAHHNSVSVEVESVASGEKYQPVNGGLRRI
jgi:hypothetical protein